MVRNMRHCGWTVLVAVLCWVHNPAPAEQSSIAPKVDENSLTQLHGQVSRGARPEFDRGRAPDSLPQEHILMMLRRSEPREQELQQFIRAAVRPALRRLSPVADTPAIRRAVRAFDPGHCEGNPVAQTAWVQTQ